MNEPTPAMFAVADQAHAAGAEQVDLLLGMAQRALDTFGGDSVRAAVALATMLDVPAVTTGTSSNERPLRWALAIALVRLAQADYAGGQP